MKLNELKELYGIDLEGYEAAAEQDALERSFTLDGQEVALID